MIAWGNCVVFPGDHFFLSIPDVSEAENVCFLGQPGLTAELWTKSGRILGCLGLLSQWFRVGWAANVILSLKPQIASGFGLILEIILEATMMAQKLVTRCIRGYGST